MTQKFERYKLLVDVLDSDTTGSKSIDLIREYFGICVQDVLTERNQASKWRQITGWIGQRLSPSSQPSVKDAAHTQMSKDMRDLVLSRRTISHIVHGLSDEACDDLDKVTDIYRYYRACNK